MLILLGLGYLIPFSVPDRGRSLIADDRGFFSDPSASAFIRGFLS